MAGVNFWISFLNDVCYNGTKAMRGKWKSKKQEGEVGL